MAVRLYSVVTIYFSSFPRFLYSLRSRRKNFFSDFLAPSGVGRSSLRYVNCMCRSPKSKFVAIIQYSFFIRLRSLTSAISSVVFLFSVPGLLFSHDNGCCDTPLPQSGTGECTLFLNAAYPSPLVPCIMTVTRIKGRRNLSIFLTFSIGCRIL